MMGAAVWRNATLHGLILAGAVVMLYPLFVVARQFV